MVPRERRTARDNLEVGAIHGGGGALSLFRCGDAEMAPVNRGSTATDEWTRRAKRRRATGSCEPLPTERGDADILALGIAAVYTNEWTRAQRRSAAGSCEPLPEMTTRISEFDARKGISACE